VFCVLFIVPHRPIVVHLHVRIHGPAL